MGSSELAEHAHLDRPRTSKAVTTLAGKKRLSRTSRVGDARQIQLELTPAGSALHAQLFPLVGQINRDVLRVLQPQEILFVGGHAGAPAAKRRHPGR